MREGVSACMPAAHQSVNHHDGPDNVSADQRTIRRRGNVVVPACHQHRNGQPSNQVRHVHRIQLKHNLILPENTVV